MGMGALLLLLVLLFAEPALAQFGMKQGVVVPLADDVPKLQDVVPLDGPGPVGCPLHTWAYHGGSHCCKVRTQVNGAPIEYRSTTCGSGVGSDYVECPLGNKDGACKASANQQQQQQQQQQQAGGGSGTVRARQCPAGTAPYHDGSHCCRKPFSADGKLITYSATSCGSGAASDYIKCPHGGDVDGNCLPSAAQEAAQEAVLLTKQAACAVQPNNTAPLSLSARQQERLWCEEPPTWVSVAAPFDASMGEMCPHNFNHGCCGARGGGRRISKKSTRCSGDKGNSKKLLDILPELRDRRIALIGDSLSEQIFVALAWSLQHALPDTRWVRGNDCAAAKGTGTGGGARCNDAQNYNDALRGAAPYREVHSRGHNLTLSLYTFHIRRVKGDYPTAGAGVTKGLPRSVRMWMKRSKAALSRGGGGALGPPPAGAPPVYLFLGGGAWARDVPVNMFDQALAKSDIVLPSFGVHWLATDQEHFRAVSRFAAERLAAFNLQGGGRRVGLLVEAMPQHFTSKDGTGDFEDKSSLGRCDALNLGNPCVQHGGWRNMALRAAATDAGIGSWVVPLFRAMRERNDIHANQGDCTHWCYHPYVYETIFDAIFTAIHNGRVRNEALVAAVRRKTLAAVRSHYGVVIKTRTL